MSTEKLKYIPFARKYRPANFAQLMGQDVLVKTLSYCIEHKRLAQAYLLTGIRGVGKTSSARIIAKTVNCSDLKIVDKKALPCEKCQNCKNFNEHNHPDIIELDAASRTSIDDIREIIESCEYRPLVGKYKFFIIDEIHMLSKSAFNALLKIVEEPPEHVVFIFATTEVQKIPVTVISRCQRYDLKRFGFQEIFALIKQISIAEKIEIDEDAQKMIAGKSEGSARDAVALLDQASSYLHNVGENEHNISSTVIVEMLGLLETKVVIQFIKLIIANDPTAAINLLHKVYFASSSLEHFIQEIESFTAELSKYKVINNYHNPLYSEYSKDITNILIGTPLSKLTTLWQIFNQGESELKKSHNELTCVEMIIIKAIYACNLPNIENILDTEVEIEKVSSQSQHISEVKQGSKSEVKQQNVHNDFYSFLKYCHKNREVDIYYFLMNELEITEFTSSSLGLKGSVVPKSISKIEQLLQNWSGETYKVTYQKNSEFKTLKEVMLDKVRESEDYNSIKNYFPDANISDIILNK
ncbi:MAG: hypothetical protein DGJ47_000315 [Rickettsiaceae bacterium]